MSSLPGINAVFFVVLLACVLMAAVSSCESTDCRFVYTTALQYFAHQWLEVQSSSMHDTQQVGMLGADTIAAAQA